MRRGRIVTAMLIGIGLGSLLVGPVTAQGSLSAQVLRLLSRDNTWTGVQSYDARVGIVVLTNGAPPTGGTTNRLYNVAGNLFWNGGLVTTSLTAGTVTSVGLSLPGIFTVSGSPVTGAGTLTGTLATQTANTVWAGPAGGGPVAPTFRALVAADIPVDAVLNGVNTVSWASVNKAGSSLADLATRSASALSSGALALPLLTDGATAGVPLVAGGGGGDPTYAALDLASATATTGLLKAAAFPVLAGDVTTPGASLTTTLANTTVAAGTYGGVNQIPQFTVDAKGRLTAASTLAIGTHTILSATHTDTAANAVLRGALIVGNATPAWSRLAIGASGQVLRSNGTDAAWSADGSGLTFSATNVTSGTLPVARGGLGTGATPTNGQIPIGNGAGYTLNTLTGTADQILVTNGAGTITLAAPQGIATTSTPNFARLGAGGGADGSAALRLTGQGYSVLVDAGNCGSAKTFDWDLGNEQTILLNAATCAITLTNGKSGGVYRLYVVQDATGSRLATWPGSPTLKWQGGSTPTLTTTVNKIDLCTFVFNGTSYFGSCSLNY